jgi:UPF0755 protein
VRRVAVVALLGALAVAGASAVGAALLRPVASDGPAQAILIPPGESLPAIAARLYAAGLIRSPLAFVGAARLRRLDDRLQSGEYLLTPAMSTIEILEKIARGQVLLHRVTIPEGYTAAQIADAVAQAGVADRAAFLRVVQRDGGPFGLDFLEGRSNLEGYLFPDTYYFPRGLPVRQVALAMLTRFGEQVTPELRARMRSRGLSLHQVLTVASLVEREAKIPVERAIIAGVIYNRLRLGWRLEIDATVLYALGRHREQITAADLLVDSPYNTYRYVGLPPGPICSPGLAAIEAAAQPAETPYLFYVLRRDGSHAFSRTFEEHQRAVRRWRR